MDQKCNLLNYFLLRFGANFRVDKLLTRLPFVQTLNKILL